MHNNLNACRRRSFRSAWVVVILAWLVMASTLRAEIQDIREVIAKESERYHTQHFPDGRMPPKHDWRNQRQLRRGESGPTEVPGGVGYGYFFYNDALLWTNSTIADYYVVAPNFLGGNVYYLYLTSTCRAQLGTESLIEYNGANEAQFWIFDWAKYPANPWQVMIDLPTSNPQYLTVRPDEFAVTRQMIHLRNGTHYLGFADGQYQWQNQVMLFNFNRGDWDLVYSYNYGTTNLTDNIYGNGGDSIGFWGPIVETFETYTNVNPVGFDLIRLFQDNNPNAFWLSTNNSYVLTSSPWQLLTQAPNTSFTVAVSPTNISVGSYNTGTLCVTASTNVGSFSLIPPAGIISPNWVITPLSNCWDKTVAGLPPGAYSITFNPVPGLATPAQQIFTIATNSITMVQAVYGTNVAGSAPQLSTIRSGAQFILTWPTNAFGFVLQSSTNLGPSAVWNTNLPMPVVVGGQYAVTNLITGTKQFFRLIHP